MKLELKHLAPYLPYGLRFVVTSPLHKEIDYLETISYQPDQLITLQENGDWYFDTECNEINIKPILRPLSDLVNQINNNGEDFVPYEHSTFVEAMEANEYLEYLCEAKADLSQDRLLPYSIVQLLFEWHFDVFNLRSKNLCIYYDELDK